MAEISKPGNANQGVFYSNFKRYTWWPKLVFFIIILLIIIGGVLVFTHKMSAKKKVSTKTVNSIPASQISSPTHLGTPAYVYRKNQAK